MAHSFSILPTLIIAEQRAGGFTFTLPSMLGEMLSLAEDLYGPRDRSYTILGMEFSEFGPQVWYPLPADRRQIIVQLSIECMTDQLQAFFVLAHECIHLLKPSGGRKANVLEEGLATYFSEYYTRTRCRESMVAVIPSYIEARNLVEQLLSSDKGVIKRLRKRQPALYKVKVNDLLAVQPKISKKLATTLCKSFASWSGTI